MSVSEIPPRRPASSSAAMLFFAIVLPVAIIAAVLYFIWVKQPKDESVQAAHETALRTMGLGKQVHNKLDPRFADADNDLVADPPADPKQFIDPPTLTFSYVATEDPTEYQTAFADFVKHLQTVTGKPVEYVAYSSTTDELKALRDGKLHVAGLNTGNVPVAVDVCGFVPMFKIAAADGVASYETEIIVPADSSIQTPKDLKDHELTLTEPGSNSGFKAPLVLLRSQYGLEPERDFQLRFSNSHDESIKGIASKQYQAAAVANNVLKRAVARGEISPNQYRRIFITKSSFPTACFGCVYNLKPELAAKVRQAFETFKWPGTSMEREFSKSDEGAFVPAKFKDDWSMVMMIDTQIGHEYKLDP